MQAENRAMPRLGRFGALGGGGEIGQWRGDDGGQHRGHAASREPGDEDIPFLRRGGGAIHPKGAVIMQVDQPRGEEAMRQANIGFYIAKDDTGDAPVLDRHGAGRSEVFVQEQAGG
jgi:hypothetical protein